MLAYKLVCWFVGAESLAYLVDSDNLPNCLGHFFFLLPPAVLRNSCCSAPLLTLSLVSPWSLTVLECVWQDLITDLIVISLLTSEAEFLLSVDSLGL